MNEQIKKLAEQAGIVIPKDSEYNGHIYRNTIEKFARLIVKECYDHCKDQLMDKSLAEEAGLDYNDGVMDCAIGLKEHFGVDK